MKAGLSRAKLGEILCEAIAGFDAPSQLSPVFAVVSPYQPDCAAVLMPRVDTLADRLWHTLRALATELEPAQLLFNSWAVAVESPAALALLARAAMRSDDAELVAAARHLTRIPTGPVAADPLGAWLVANDAAELTGIPDLGPVARIVPGVRICYALAHWWYAAASAREIISAAMRQPNCTDWLRRRELLRVFTTPLARSGEIDRLDESEFFLLPARAQAILFSDERLLDRVLPESLRGETNLAERARESRKAQDRLISSLLALRRALESRDFARATRGLAAIEVDDYSAHHQAQLTDGVDLAAAHPDNVTRAQTPWRLLPPDALAKLARLAPCLRLPLWWTVSPDEVAVRLAQGELKPEAIPDTDLHRISLAWRDRARTALAQARLGRLVPAESTWWARAPLTRFFEGCAEHPAAAALVSARLTALTDARPLLQLLPAVEHGSIIAVQLVAAVEHAPTASARLIELAGTPLWERCWPVLAAARWPLAQAGLDFLVRGGVPADRLAFLRCLVDAIAEVSPLERQAEAAVALLDRAPDAASLLATQLTAEGLRQVVVELRSPQAIEALEGTLPAEFAADLWHARVARLARGEPLRDLLLTGAAAHRVPVWQTRWLLNPRGKAHLCALVLAARRSVPLLRQIRARVDGDVLAAALLDAAARLPAAAGRDAAFLQLLAHVGMAQVAHLAAVMAQMDRAAAPGHKLDAAYLTWTLPKRSGGHRTISTPAPSLKIIQRALLERLLTPLGAHPGAFGFVRERSIVGNAAVHVGQPVVTNVDIQNCFPSVRWSLVLAALRRDLGSRLAPATISLLVDICTAHGGLPIGAPTSPALLNRVLLKTDQILHAAAQRRGCRYTRYADDLSFSGDHGAVELIGQAERTLGQIGLALDPKKTNIYRRGRRQIVTGLVVNERVSVPRRLRRRVRAAVHALEQGRMPRWHDRDESAAALAGRVAFIQAVNPLQAQPLAARLKQLRRGA